MEFVIITGMSGAGKSLQLSFLILLNYAKVHLKK
jgi:RNase adaptor protein for sRNA GlmZ degradation